MTTEQKFNYIKDTFYVCEINGYLHFALLMKNKRKEYPTMSDIIVSKELGCFAFDGLPTPDSYIYTDYEQFVKCFGNEITLNVIEKDYNNLIEFENKVKQLNGG